MSLGVKWEMSLSVLQSSYEYDLRSGKHGACCAVGLRTSVLPSAFYLFIYLIYLFLAALGLRCCTWTFSSCGERGLLFVAARGLLIVVASLVAEHGL